MEVDPKRYNDVNKVSYGKANELIDRIIEENPNKKFDYVLDVGCGTGNVTVLLNRRLNIKQLYAIDIDEAMIRFAKNNYPQDNIEYLVQDIGVEWDKLTPELKALEGKVSLIFSNYAIHWVKDKANTAINLLRLLSTDGILYADISYFYDPFLDLNSTEKEIYEQAIKIPNRKQQLSSWELLFKNAGFKAVDIQFSTTEFLFDKETFRKIIVPIEAMARRIFITEKSELKTNYLIERLKEKLFEDAPKFIDQITGSNMVRYDSNIFVTKLVKNVY